MLEGKIFVDHPDIDFVQGFMLQTYSFKFTPEILSLEWYHFTVEGE